MQSLEPTPHQTNMIVIDALYSSLHVHVLQKIPMPTTDMLLHVAIHVASIYPYAVHMEYKLWFVDMPLT